MFVTLISLLTIINASKTVENAVESGGGSLLGTALFLVADLAVSRPGNFFLAETVLSGAAGEVSDYEGRGFIYGWAVFTLIVGILLIPVRFFIHMRLRPIGKPMLCHKCCGKDLPEVPK